jgi:acid phosphatase type 7
VSAQGITVMAESHTADPVYVEYGATKAYGLRVGSSDLHRTTAPSWMHAVRLRNLAPGTVYHYRVLRGRDTTADATFRTAPLGYEPVRFVWMADFQVGTAVHDSIAVLARLARPDFLLYGGDLAWSGSYVSLRNEFFRPPQEALIREIAFFNTAGNHEGWGRNPKALTDAPPSASGTSDYYSFDYGPLHVVVLNTELDIDPGSTQWLFADRDLKETNAPWKIVIAHMPGYAPGGPEDERMRIVSERIFGPRKVDLFLAGHAHFYQHNLLDGVHQMCIGSAGGGLHDPAHGEHTIALARRHCYAVADVDAARLRLVVYSTRNVPLDSLVLTKSP